MTSSSDRLAQARDAARQRVVPYFLTGDHKAPDRLEGVAILCECGCGETIMMIHDMLEASAISTEILTIAVKVSETKAAIYDEVMMLNANFYGEERAPCLRNLEDYRADGFCRQVGHCD